MPARRRDPRGLPTPAYRKNAPTGPHHDPEFRVAVALPDAGVRLIQVLRSPPPPPTLTGRRPP